MLPPEHCLCHHHLPSTDTTSPMHQLSMLELLLTTMTPQYHPHTPCQQPFPAGQWQPAPTCELPMTFSYTHQNWLWHHWLILGCTETTTNNDNNAVPTRQPLTTWLQCISPLPCTMWSWPGKQDCYKHYMQCTTSTLTLQSLWRPTALGNMQRWDMATLCLPTWQQAQAKGEWPSYGRQSWHIGPWRACTYYWPTPSVPHLSLDVKVTVVMVMSSGNPDVTSWPSKPKFHAGLAHQWGSLGNQLLSTTTGLPLTNQMMDYMFTECT